MSQTETKQHHVGYSALIAQYDLQVLPHYRRSLVTAKGRGYSHTDFGEALHVYPKGYLPNDLKNPMQQLEFALKYDGLNLEIIHALFQKLDTTLIVEHIKKHPYGNYSRKIWFLYEWLMNEELPISNTKKGNYIEILDGDTYYTTTGIRSPRHRVIDNLLGNPRFCPIVRKTEKLIALEQEQIEKQANNLIKNYEQHIISRAINYLYIKETMSSFAIEREQPDKKRETRFVELLSNADKLEEMNKDILLELQSNTVDWRFRNFDYRFDQNYVGEQLNPYVTKIHYISPKPEDVPNLMTGLLEALQRMQASEVHPVIIATTIAFGFVFIHPFDDGNGRIHRFLIHHVLAKAGFTPNGFIFPVSAVMLKNMREYDKILESYSKPLLNTIPDYFLSNEGELSVSSETKQHYQYIDFTFLTEYLFNCIKTTIFTDFQTELEFIKNYDITKAEIQATVDMPDKLIDFMIKFICQNNGKLSKAKNEKYFQQLTDDEVQAMERIVNKHMSACIARSQKHL